MAEKQKPKPKAEVKPAEKFANEATFIFNYRDEETKFLKTMEFHIESKNEIPNSLQEVLENPQDHKIMLVEGGKEHEVLDFAAQNYAGMEGIESVKKEPVEASAPPEFKHFTEFTFMDTAGEKWKEVTLKVYSKTENPKLDDALANPGEYYLAYKKGKKEYELEDSQAKKYHEAGVAEKAKKGWMGKKMGGIIEESPYGPKAKGGKEKPAETAPGKWVLSSPEEKPKGSIIEEGPYGATSPKKAEETGKVKKTGKKPEEEKLAKAGKKKKKGIIEESPYE